jgi:hypothetical protein
LCFERHFIQLKSECQDTISYENFEDAELKIAELKTAMTAFEAAGLNIEQGQIVNVKALREQLGHQKQKKEAREQWKQQQEEELQKARNDVKKMTQLYKEEKERREADIREAEDRFKREQEERRKEAAHYKKQMEDMQVQTLRDIDQRLQQHTEALEKRSTSWFTSGKKTKEMEAALVKLEEERAGLARRTEEERKQYEADQERKMEGREREHKRQMAEIQAKLKEVEAKTAEAEARERAKTKEDEKTNMSAAKSSSTTASPSGAPAPASSFRRAFASTVVSSSNQNRQSSFQVTVKKVVTKKPFQAQFSGHKFDSQDYIVPNGYRSAGQSVKYRPEDASEKGQQIWLKLPAPERLPSGWEERHDSVKGDSGYSWVNTHNQKNVVEVRPIRAAVRPWPARAPLQMADQPNTPSSAAKRSSTTASPSGAPAPASSFRGASRPPTGVSSSPSSRISTSTGSSSNQNRQSSFQVTVKKASLKCI